MGTLEPILEKLAMAQTAFFRAADAIPPTAWNTKPQAEQWSAGELVAHLVMVERAVVGGADRISQKVPKHIPFLETVPFSIVAGGEPNHSPQDANPSGSKPDWK